MKRLPRLLAPLCALALLTFLSGCGKPTQDQPAQTQDANTEKTSHSHGKDGHSHGADGHSHGADGHSHGEGGDHSHGPSIEKGPNGGRMVTSVKPHLELLVQEDRKIRLTAVSEADIAIPITTQEANIIGGDRSNPSELDFSKVGKVLVSDAPLPEGLDVPIVLSIIERPGAKVVVEKIQLNLRDCPCDGLKYACACPHEH